MMLEKILSAVREIAKDATGELGFGFLDFNTGKSCCVNGEKPLPTASVFKIFVLMEHHRHFAEELIAKISKAVYDIYTQN